jgi:hypothetical protein
LFKGLYSFSHKISKWVFCEQPSYLSILSFCSILEESGITYPFMPTV